MTLVCSDDLFQGLRVDRTTLLEWHNAGFLRRHSVGWYEESEIDRFLATCAVDFEWSPRWSDISSGRLRLLLCSEAVEQFHFSNATAFRVFCDQELVARIKFPRKRGNIRYCHASTEQAAVRQHPLRAKDVALLFDVHRDIPARWLAKGLIVCPIASHEHPEGSPYLFRLCWIAMLQAICSPQLVESIPAFVDGRLQRKEKIRFVDEKTMCRQAGVTATTLSLWVSRGYVPYIASPSGFKLYSEAWARILRDSSYVVLPLKAEQVAKLFGVESGVISRWKREGRIQCPILGHTHGPESRFLQRECWIAYLEENCSPALRPQMARFFDSRVAATKPPALLSITDVGHFFGHHPQWVRHALERGALHGLRLPSGVTRFAEEWLRPSE